MNGCLSLDFNDLAIDPKLMARLPAGLALYYLAAPLAYEDGAVSVAMAYPENDTAIAVLGNLLAAPVVPVYAPAAAIREVLSRYNTQKPGVSPRVLAWSSTEENAGLVAEMAHRFSPCLAASVTVLSSADLVLDNVLTVAREGQYTLTVIYPPQDVAPSLLLLRLPTPLLVLRNTACHFRRMLIFLRGYSADEQILDWLTPLLQPESSVTLMPLPPSDEATGHLSVRHNLLEGGHLRACLQHPVLRHTRPLVRLRQGGAADQAADETNEDDYDLIVIAAEGYGHFVRQILATIEGQRVNRRPSFFVLRPPVVTGDARSRLERQERAPTWELER